MGDRRVAVEDLQEGRAEDGVGVEEVVAPGVSGGAAGVEDGGAVGLRGEVGLEPAEGADDPVVHGGPSFAVCRRATPA
jgi:hypothetical protein